MRLQTITPRMAAAIGNKVKSGAIISAVIPGSPAAQAGLRIGEIIDGFDDERVTDSRTLDRAAAVSIGKPMQLRVGAMVRREPFPS